MHHVVTLGASILLSSLDHHLNVPYLLFCVLSPFTERKFYDSWCPDLFRLCPESTAVVSEGDLLSVLVGGMEKDRRSVLPGK